MGIAALRALIFDVDGTMADTEQAHLAAFNEAFEQEGLGWHWSVEQYRGLLEVSGGRERILHYWRRIQPDLKDIAGGAVADTVQRLHALKTAAYERSVQEGAVQMRPGVLHLMQAAARDGLTLAIATTTSPVNIAALLRKSVGPDWSHWFAVVEDASTAPRKKPHPQVYENTLRRLGQPAAACLAFEDSANGLRAAMGAALDAVITPNEFTSHHDFTGALRVVPSLSGVTVEQLRHWRESSQRTVRSNQPQEAAMAAAPARRSS